MELDGLADAHEIADGYGADIAFNVHDGTNEEVSAAKAGLVLIDDPANEEAVVLESIAVRLSDFGNDVLEDFEGGAPCQGLDHVVACGGDDEGAADGAAPLADEGIDAQRAGEGGADNASDADFILINETVLAVAPAEGRDAAEDGSEGVIGVGGQRGRERGKEAGQRRKRISKDEQAARLVLDAKRGAKALGVVFGGGPVKIAIGEAVNLGAGKATRKEGDRGAGLNLPGAILCRADDAACGDAEQEAGRERIVDHAHQAAGVSGMCTGEEQNGEVGGPFHFGSDGLNDGLKGAVRAFLLREGTGDAGSSLAGRG